MSRRQVPVSAAGQRRMMHSIFFLVRIIEHALRLAHWRWRHNFEAGIRELMVSTTHLSCVAVLTSKSWLLIRREVGVVRWSSGRWAITKSLCRQLPFLGRTRTSSVYSCINELLLLWCCWLRIHSGSWGDGTCWGWLMISRLTYVIIHEITCKSYCLRRFLLSLLCTFRLWRLQRLVHGFLRLRVPVLAKNDVIVVLWHIVSQIIVLS